MTKKTNSGWAFAGIGAAALAAALGLTYKQWLPSAPQRLIAEQTAPAQTAPAAAPQPAPAPQTAAETPAQPAPAQQVASAEPPPKVEGLAVARPTFDTVRVEKTGEAVIAGRAEPGAQVTVKLGDLVVGTVQAGQDGTFALVPDKPLPPGSGVLSLEETAGGAAAPLKSDQVVAVVVPEQKANATPLVAVLSPDRPTKVLQKPAEAPAAAPAPAAAKPVASAGLSLDAVDYDQAGNIVFSGRFAAGSTARVYVDNKLAGEARAGDDSRWSFSGASQIASGVHALRIDGLDGKGAVIARVEAPFFREAAQKVASAAASDAPATTATETTVQPAASSATQPAAAPAQTAIAPAQPSQAQTASAAPEPVKPKEGRVVIQPGNNLWRIATVIYGSGVKYTVLYGANKDLIRNPNLIYPGQVFKTPDVMPPEQIDPHRTAPLQPGASSAQ